VLTLKIDMVRIDMIDMVGLQIAAATVVWSNRAGSIGPEDLHAQSIVFLA